MDRRRAHLPATPAVPQPKGRIIMVNPAVRSRSQACPKTDPGIAGLSQARFGASNKPKSLSSSERSDRDRQATQQARHRRLARLYDRVDRRAIGSTDPRVLATLTLTHWLYVRAAAAMPYSWRKMASDYRFNLLKQAGCRRPDIRTMDRHSRPQIVRRILIARYIASRANRHKLSS